MFLNERTEEEIFLECVDMLLEDIGRYQPELLEVIVEELEYGFILEENVKEQLRDVKNKTVLKTKSVTRAVPHKINKTGEHIDNLIKITRKHIVGETRDELMTNHTKVSTVIKRVLTSGALYLISPTIGLLHIFITTALRKKLKVREQEKILADLKLELEICEEKINDATNNNDKKAKYELMRLRNSLKKNIIRVQQAGRGMRNIG